MTDNNLFLALKERFKNQENKSGNKFKNNTIYPFWQMKVGEEAVIRLLPDKNASNPNLFYIEFLEHTLAIDGKDTKIPCLKTYGEPHCPICELSSKYYSAGDEIKGKYFYRKKNTLVSFLVLKDPLPADPETGETAEGKVKRSNFGFQLMEKIKMQIAKDLDVEPWDFKRGYDFVIAKTPNGKETTYAIGSGFARNPTAIPEKYLANLECIDLQTLLPKNPGIDKVQRMLDAHLTGKSLEENNSNDSSASDKTNVAAAPSQPQPAQVIQSQVAAVSDNDEDDDDEILRRLLERNSN